MRAMKHAEGQDQEGLMTLAIQKRKSIGVTGALYLQRFCRRCRVSQILGVSPSSTVPGSVHTTPAEVPGSDHTALACGLAPGSGVSALTLTLRPMRPMIPGGNSVQFPGWDNTEEFVNIIIHCFLGRPLCLSCFFQICSGAPAG